MNDNIKVLIVDDSAAIRRILSAELSTDPVIEVVDTAPDAIVAQEKIAVLSPDILLLDIEMPIMDGLTFLEKLMAYHPMPVIIVSSLVNEKGSIAIMALKLGALGVIAKPDLSYSVSEMGKDLKEKIKEVYFSKIK